ncbi:MAG: lytic transglycosylase domain-containing protein [Spirochaetota bacterium]
MSVKNMTTLHRTGIPTIIMLLTFSMALPVRADSKIKERVHKDGTIEYYSADQAKACKRTASLANNRYDHLIKAIAKQKKVDPQLIRCIVQVESSFDADAVSVAGAMGLMQLMQEIVHYYKVKDPFDPRQNLEAGIVHFAHLVKYFKGEVPLALAAYHAGLGRVKKNWSVPPIKSTMQYVKKVMQLYDPDGKTDYNNSVKKLYKRISSDGTLHIYSEQ